MQYPVFVLGGFGHRTGRYIHCVIPDCTRKWVETNAVVYTVCGGVSPLSCSKQGYLTQRRLCVWQIWTAERRVEEIMKVGVVGANV
jgi:hypothetical protein